MARVSSIIRIKFVFHIMTNRNKYKDFIRTYLRMNAFWATHFYLKDSTCPTRISKLAYVMFVRSGWNEMLVFSLLLFLSFLVPWLYTGVSPE